MSTLPARYKPTGNSAKGGFGEVHFCQDQHLDRPVAVKFLHDLSQKARVLDELRALLQMRSKHVVQIYDVVPCEDGSMGLVEEFVGGIDLWNSPFPKSSVENFLKTLWQIASGIADIHSARIIHRDIKPNNMKLDDEGLVKIYDFGLARDEGVDAQTKGFKGTFGFAAPEILTDNTVAFTRAIDTYAFGASVFILAGDEIPQSLRGLVPTPPAAGFFRQLKIPLPFDLADLLESCLATDPDDRPELAYVRDELARHLLKWKHQAMVIFNGKPSYLNADVPTVSLQLPNVGSITITYDGIHFKVTNVGGETFINNSAANIGDVIPGSCVVAFGSTFRQPSERAFITFDVSNPEVVL